MQIHNVIPSFFILTIHDKWCILHSKSIRYLHLLSFTVLKNHFKAWMYQNIQKCIQMYPTTPKYIKMYPNKQKSTKCTKMYSGFLLLTSITKVQLYLSIHDCCILCNPQTTRNGIHAYKRDISFQNLYCLLLSITVLIWYYIPYCYITSRAVCILMWPLWRRLY